MRTSKIERVTKETNISAKLKIDGKGNSKIECKIGFLTHMLETFARHGLFDLDMVIEGDLHVDQHHTVEDTGIVLGMAFKDALKEKRGIKRAGFFIYPMDEVLAMCALDISGRTFFKFDVKLNSKQLGDLQCDLVEDFFSGFASALGINLHINIYYGRSDHHKVEAVFKAFAKSLKMACEIEERIKDEIPSTKGVL